MLLKKANMTCINCCVSLQAVSNRDQRPGNANERRIFSYGDELDYGLSKHTHASPFPSSIPSLLRVTPLTDVIPRTTWSSK
jgi:hypothetical protein